MIRKLIQPLISVANVLNRSAIEADQVVAEYATTWSIERQVELAARYDAAMRRIKPEKLAAFQAAVAARESSE